MNDPNEHRAVCQDRPHHKGWHSPIYQSSEQQALETFKHSAEQWRFLRHERWTVTNYALIAYAALAAAPEWLGTNSWLVPASVCAFLLVWAAFLQAWRLLADQQDRMNMELDRLRRAQNHLRLIRQIHEDNPQYIDRKPEAIPARKYRKWYQLGRPTQWRGFAAILFLGGAVASLIILSRIPWKQVISWICPLASDLPDQALLSF